MRAVTLSGAPAANVASINPSTAAADIPLLHPLFHLQLGDESGQAVRTEEEPIAGAHLLAKQVEPQRGLNADGAGDGTGRLSGPGSV